MRRELGEEVERFKITHANVGEGGFGRIDRAVDLDLERHVAIKTLDPLFKIEPSPKDIERFRREAKALARLTHPNIPAIYDVKIDESAKQFQIIFEWVEGRTARDVLKERGTFSMEEARNLMTHLCSALTHAHDCEIIHRDIKPSNIIVSSGSEGCYLVDIGLALSKQDMERLTGKSALGTPGYMSPEQQRGEVVDARSDVYSLGILLYEFLSGQLPSMGGYRPLSTFNEAIPPTIDDLVKSCLLERNLRLKSTKEFIDRLSRALRPHGSLSDVLTRGSLHELQIALAQMDRVAFANLPPGQRRLVLSRVADLTSVDDPKMRNAIAEILAELTRIALIIRSEEYEPLVKAAFDFGFTKKYSEMWTGNIRIREALQNASLEAPPEGHDVLARKCLEFFDAVTEWDNQEKWFVHDLRLLLQHSLANQYCSEPHANELGDRLDKLNAATH